MRYSNHLIDGAWTDGASAELGDAIDPYDGAPIGSWRRGSAADVDAAVAAARRCFEAGGWSNAPRRRAEALYAMADALAAGSDRLAALAIRESGKRRAEIGHEIAAGVSELRYYAGLARAVYGRVQEVEPGALSIFAREPAGVAAVVVPWNAPITLLIRSLAPALAAGCTAVIKPAPQTTLTNALLLDLWSGIDALPPGAINSVNENGIAVGQALAAHPDVDVISFTGSAATGRKVMAAASGTLKRLSLELGGKSPAVVFADADLDAAAATVTRCALVMAGQMCTAISRVVVEAPAFDALAERLADRFRAIRLGDPADGATDMGPLVDKAAQARLAALTAGAAADPAVDVLVAGGVPDDQPAGGACLSPTLIATDALDSRWVQDELFGPILVLERFADEAEAAHRANATVYGLAASCWTADHARAQRMARALRFGTVWLNSHNRLFAEAETGGFKQSGFGRLHGLEGMNDFLETKHVFSEAGWTPAMRVD